MLKELILGEILNIAVDALQVCTYGHHCLLRLKKALSLSFIEDVIVTDGRTEIKAQITT